MVASWCCMWRARILSSSAPVLVDSGWGGVSVAFDDAVVLGAVVSPASELASVSSGASVDARDRSLTAVMVATLIGLTGRNGT